MATTFRDLKIVDPDTSTTYNFAYFKDGQRALRYETRPWEPHDPKVPFRIPVFPFGGGLGPDRLNNSPTYAKGNCDSTVPNKLLFPPKLNAVTLTDITDNVRAIAEYNTTKIFFAGDDTDSYYFNPADNSVTKVAVGNNVKGLVRFESELWAWHGDGTIISKYNGSTWAQGADAVHADAMGVVDSKLWRAEGNLISNTEADPETLANWVPASGSEYECGDATDAVHTIIEYQGTIWCGRPDGMYAADPNYKFHNQTPQLKQSPHPDNCKGAFVAHGRLWVPSASGLYRIGWGESVKYGPELAGRPDYNFWVRGGVEFGGDIFLLCTDELGVEDTVIIRMVRSKLDPNQYTYHEWCRLGNATKGYAIAIATSGTNYKLLVAHGTNMQYIDLGRGGGLWVDDPNYNFGNSMVLESGPLRPARDLTMLSIAQGVEILLKYPASNDIMSILLRTDGGTGANLITTDTFEGGGTGSWATGGTNSIASVATRGVAGQRSMECTYQDNDQLAYFTHTATAERYHWSCWLYIPSDYDGGGIELTDNGTFAGATGTQSVAADMTLTDQWQRLVTDITPVSGDLTGNWELRNTGAAPTAGRSVFIDITMACPASGNIPDSSATYSYCYSDQETLPTTTHLIKQTTDYETVIRYAPNNSVHHGHFHEVKFQAGGVSNAGTTRSEVLECWLFGWIRPKVTDIYTLTINADEGELVGLGLRTGVTTDEITRLFRSWANGSTILTCTFETYDEAKTNRFLVADVIVEDGEERIGYGENNIVTKLVTVTLVRVPFAPDYAA